MRLQSIRRTPIDAVLPGVDEHTYRHSWPELRLKAGSVGQHIPPGSIAVGVVDSGVPEEDFDGPVKTRNPQGRPVGRGRQRDDDGHASLLSGTLRGGATGSPLIIDVRPIKFFDAQAWPEPDPGAAAIQAVAAQSSPRVIVLAWDVGHTTHALRQAILSLKQSAVVVIAAGNWSLDNDEHHNWPANYGRERQMDHVITVMATDEHDERAAYSSYGRESVFIAAPGFAKVEPAPSSSALRNSGSLRDSFRVFRGTSAATAHVARLAALVIAKNPTFTPSDVRSHIEANSRHLPALAKYCRTGAIVDFEEALK